MVFNIVSITDKALYYLTPLLLCMIGEIEKDIVNSLINKFILLTIINQVFPADK